MRVHSAPGVSRTGERKAREGKGMPGHCCKRTQAGAGQIMHHNTTLCGIISGTPSPYLQTEAGFFLGVCLKLSPHVTTLKV